LYDLERLHDVRRPTINILIGYGYHPITTATYLQRALERRAATTFVGTPWAASRALQPRATCSRSWQTCRPNLTFTYTLTPAQPGIFLVG
jgi:hypothetical protein